MLGELTANVEKIRVSSVIMHALDQDFFLSTTCYIMDLSLESATDWPQCPRERCQKYTHSLRGFAQVVYSTSMGNNSERTSVGMKVSVPRGTSRG